MKLWKKYGFPEPKSEASIGTLSLIDYEIFSGITVKEKAFVARLDGWRFHPLTKKLKLEKPFDKFFINCLAKTAKNFFPEFNPCFAYLFSDEINFLFLHSDIFSGRIEKLDSVFAGLASCYLKQELEKKFKVRESAFDCRIIPLPRKKIQEYFIWRQAEAFRNHNNAFAQTLLMEKKGYSARKASKELQGMKTLKLKRMLLKEFNFDLSSTKKWQRNGIMLYREEYLKKGFNPIEKKQVTVKRKRIKTDLDIPMFSSGKGKNYLKRIVKEFEKRRKKPN